MKSAFKFESYKVDIVRLDIQRIMGLIELTGNIDPSLWNMSLTLREPLYFKKQNKYLGGLDTLLTVMSTEPETEKKTDDKNVPLIKVVVGIAGLFSAVEGSFPKETEDNLVKIQIPVILLPYVRATISSLLANAGFGSVMLPLININELAKKSFGDIQVKVIE